MAHGAHFLFDTRPMIYFKRGYERYGDPFRYLGRRAIFPTQTLRAAGIWIFSARTSGGDLYDKGDFQRETPRAP